MNRQDQIEQAILTAFTDGKADWDLIMKSVASKVHVQNGGWLEVRGVLQKLKNEGTIRRDPDFHVELYHRICGEN